MADPVWVNGELVPAGAPALRADDQGFTLGLAVFDSLLLEDGCLWHAEEHLARLRRSAEGARIPWPADGAPERALLELAQAVGWRDRVVRLTLSRGSGPADRGGSGPTLVASARAIERAPPEGAVVAIARLAKLAGDPLEALKSTNRLRNALAREEALAAGAWEALIPTQEGDLAEGTLSNLFAVRGSRVTTPPVERGCLEGVMRSQVLALLERGALRAPGGAEIRDPSGGALAPALARLERADLAQADEVFLTNTSGRVIPVRSILGLRPRLPGAAGPVAAAIGEGIRTAEREHRATSAGRWVGPARPS